MLKGDYAEAFRLAAARDGGYTRLAEFLGVEVHEVMRWASGYGSPSPEILMRVIELNLRSGGLAQAPSAPKLEPEDLLSSW